MPRLILSAYLLLLLLGPAASAGIVQHVVHVSVEGLRPDAITNLGPANAPNFYRMRTEGAFTDNAKSDADFTVTLPNHTTQLTGRGVLGPAGHNWEGNDDPEPGQTLHTNRGSYVAGVFDVMHDRSLPTGLYTGKTKFSLFDLSWDSDNGAPDAFGPDNGRDKIDVYDADSELLTLQLVTDMTANPFGYVFLHLADGDFVGHASGWDPTPGSDYSNAIIAIDGRLGLLFTMIDGDQRLAGHTVVILTADHGGFEWDHSDPERLEDFTVPFYVWGPGVSAGIDLYAAHSVAWNLHVHPLQAQAAFQVGLTDWSGRKTTMATKQRAGATRPAVEYPTEMMAMLPREFMRNDGGSDCTARPQAQRSQATGKVAADVLVGHRTSGASIVASAPSLPALAGGGRGLKLRNEGKVTTRTNRRWL